MGISPPTSATRYAAEQSQYDQYDHQHHRTTTTDIRHARGISLNTLANLNATDFQVTIPSANLSAVMGDTDTKLIQNPQIRSLDNQKASLKIGERLPVATGSFQPGIGGVGINPLVNTQFQYLDVGVNIDVTPHVHSDGEVTLKITMEVSSVIGQASIGGITQPIIGQKKSTRRNPPAATAKSSLIGGIMDDSADQVAERHSWTGADSDLEIPVWPDHAGPFAGRNRLRHHSARHSWNATLTEINQRAIDIGTANTIVLRHISMPQAAPAIARRRAGQNLPRQLLQLRNPALHPAPTRHPAAGANPASFLFDPATIQAAKGNTFAVNLLLSGAQNVYSVPVQVELRSEMLQLVNVSNGGFLSQDGQAVALVHREDDAHRTIANYGHTAARAGGVSGRVPS